jgi:hypothetical protein
VMNTLNGFSGCFELPIFKVIISSLGLTMMIWSVCGCVFLCLRFVAIVWRNQRNRISYLSRLRQVEVKKEKPMLNESLFNQFVQWRLIVEKSITHSNRNALIVSGRNQINESYARLGLQMSLESIQIHWIESKWRIGISGLYEESAYESNFLRSRMYNFPEPVH